MTREAINKLTDVQRAHLDNIVCVANYATKIYNEQEHLRYQIKGYCQCLQDCGVLTEYERKAVYLYYRSQIKMIY